MSDRYVDKVEAASQVVGPVSIGRHDGAGPEQWQPVTVHTGKDEAASMYAAEHIDAQPKRCWTNARRLVLEMEEYAASSYVEGIAVLDILGLPIEHGWVCRPDGTVIDPTLPSGVLAYFPGLEFQGRHGIRAFLATSNGRKDPESPFFFSYGFGGSRSPTYAAAWKQACAFSGSLPLPACE